MKTRFSCPDCSNDQVQKVSAIVRAGTWSGRSSSVGLTGGHVYGGSDFSAVTTTSGSSSGASHLAQALRPPVLCSNNNGCGIAFVVVLALFCACMTLRCFNASGGPNTESTTGAGLVFLLLTGVLFALIAFQLRESWHPTAIAARQERERRHREALARWSALFYCSRCDRVYDPATGRSAEIGTMVTLL